MASLDRAIRDSFLIYSWGATSPENFQEGMLLEITVDRTANIIEIPVFALSTFLSDPEVDKLVCLPYIPLNRRDSYKSIESNVKWVFGQKLDNRLIKFTVQSNDMTFVCYVGFGTLFILDNDNVIPLACSTFKLKKQDGAWRQVGCTMRINRYCVTIQNTVTRFVIGKFMRETSGAAVYVEGNKVFPEITIGEIPITAMFAEQPNIRTSNQHLIKAVLDNLDNAILQ